MCQRGAPSRRPVAVPSFACDTRLMSSASRTLRDRLIAVAGVALVACGGSTTSTTSTTSSEGGASANAGSGGSSAVGGAAAAGGTVAAGGTAAAGGTLSAGGAAGSGMAGNGGTGGGPTAACHVGLACVADEWCGYATGEPQTMPCGGCGVPNEHCECAAGAFSCGASPGFQGPVTVCYVASEACLPQGDPAILPKLQSRFGPGCPGLLNVMSAPTPATASDGTAECCYTVGLAACLGRPLTCAGVARIADLRRRHDWLSLRSRARGPLEPRSDRPRDRLRCILGRVMPSGSQRHHLEPRNRPLRPIDDCRRVAQSLPVEREQ